MKKKSSARKALSIISVLVLCVSVVLFSLIIAARVKGEIPGVFGYSFHIVVTDSMKPEINVDDMVVARKTNRADVALGDDIVFVSPDPELKGIVVVHRVVGIRPDGGLVTQGIKVGAPVDDYAVYDVKGRVVSVSPFLGKVFSGMSNNRNIIFGVALAVLLVIIVDEAIHIYLEVYRRKLATKKGRGNSDCDEETPPKS